MFGAEGGKEIPLSSKFQVWARRINQSLYLSEPTSGRAYTVGPSPVGYLLPYIVKSLGQFNALWSLPREWGSTGIYKQQSHQGEEGSLSHFNQNSESQDEPRKI